MAQLGNEEVYREIREPLINDLSSSRQFASMEAELLILVSKFSTPTVSPTVLVINQDHATNAM